MGKAKKLRELKEEFYVKIDGLKYAENELERLGDSWFMNLMNTTKKQFFVAVVPKLKEMQDKFNKELEEFLEEQSQLI